jgi:hypothetical protein
VQLIQKNRQPVFELSPVSLEQRSPPLHFNTAFSAAEVAVYEKSSDKAIGMRERRKQAHGSSERTTAKPSNRHREHAPRITGIDASLVIAEGSKAGPPFAMGAGERGQNTALQFIRDVLLSRKVAAHNELHVHLLAASALVYTNRIVDFLK